MARAYSIESVEYAPVTADGSLPTSGWKKISPISDDSVDINIPPITVNEIRAQDIDGVIEVLPGDTEAPNLAFNSLEVDGAVASDFMGGTYDSATQSYEAPAVPEIKEFAFRVTSKPLNNVKVRFHFRKMSVLSNIAISAIRTDLYKIGFTARSKTPLNAQGVPQSPWGWRVIPAAQTT